MRNNWTLLLLLPLGTLVFSCAALRSTRVADAAENKVIYLTDSLPIYFRRIPAGEFLMGSPETEAGRGSDEGPLHRVRITRDFYLGVYEVTQAQWQYVMGNNPAVFQHMADHLEHPVESVSWSDVQLFIRKLNDLGLGTFRLPTEAEWEYACRAGSTTSYYWGDDPQGGEVDRYGWVNSRSFAMTHPVGQKLPNAWGLYDMVGNVWEWCEDRYGPYRAEEQVDPKGAEAGDRRVFRGGSWYDFADAQRSANRHRHGTERGYTAIGLRLIMEESNTGR